MIIKQSLHFSNIWSILHEVDAFCHENGSQGHWTVVGTLRSTMMATSQKIRFISKTIALHVRYEFWYISLPSSAKQENEI